MPSAGGLLIIIKEHEKMKMIKNLSLLRWLDDIEQKFWGQTYFKNLV